jgi:hypothetical protein
LHERNQALRDRYTSGETIADLARHYHISDQRIFQIIQGQRNQGFALALSSFLIFCPYSLLHLVTARKNLPTLPLFFTPAQRQSFPTFLWLFDRLDSDTKATYYISIVWKRFHVPV